MRESEVETIVAARARRVAAELHDQGMAALRDGDLALAAQRFGDASTHDPEEPRFHCHLGEVLRRMGEAVRGAASCRRAIELDPMSGAAHGNLARCLHDIGRIDDAMEVYAVARKWLPEGARGALDEAMRGLRSA